MCNYTVWYNYSFNPSSTNYWLIFKYFVNSILHCISNSLLLLITKLTKPYIQLSNNLTTLILFETIVLLVDFDNVCYLVFGYFYSCCVNCVVFLLFLLFLVEFLRKITFKFFVLWHCDNMCYHVLSYYLTFSPLFLLLIITIINKFVKKIGNW